MTSAVSDQSFATSGHRYAALAALLGALAVLCGALGSHALADLPPRAQELWQIANRYHFYHALALLVWGLSGRGGWAARLWLTGLLLFSGSLYLYALAGWRPLAIVTPLGGLLWIFAWLWAAGALWRRA